MKSLAAFPCMAMAFSASKARKRGDYNCTRGKLAYSPHSDKALRNGCVAVAT